MSRLNTLFNYIKYGNNEKVKTFFEKENIDPNDFSLNQYLLNYSITRQNKELAYFFLEKGANPNLKNIRGQNALMLIEFFMKKNFTLKEKKDFAPNNLNDTDTNQNTLLFYAINAQDYELIEWLIEKNVDINWQNDSFQTPLFLAIRESDYKIIEFLLKNGSDTEIKNESNDTVLILSCSLNDEISTSLLLDYGAKIDYLTPEGDTAFTNALLSNNLELSKKVYFDEVNLEKIEKGFIQYIDKDMMNYFKNLKARNNLDKILQPSDKFKRKKL